ncbi:MAG TPA: hypothetical protein EYP19_12830, partial [Desulfobacterales bacterium]|nr:hypothetical protein [Desulfobacterales bacterium]
MRSLYIYCSFGLLLALWTIEVWAGTLVGTVEDRTNREPLPGAAVVILGCSMGATADSLGRFTIVGLPVGRYRVEVRMMGYRTATIEVDIGTSVADGGTTEVVLTLQPTLLELDEVTVTAERVKPVAAERSPMFLRVIPSEAFEGQIVTLPEVLSRSAGVQIKTLGGLGSYSTVSIRGTTSEQVKVYLDGIPLNSALGGGVNLGEIPLSNVDRIEVYKGNIPARFGGGGIGGVVNILTKRITRHYGNYTASGGTFGTQMVHGLFSRRGDPLGYMLGIDYTKSDNNFPFLNDNGTRYNPDDDLWTQRQNNGFASFTLLTKVEVDGPRGLMFALNDNFYRSNKGIPGIGNFQSQFARLRTTRNLVEAHAVRSRPLWDMLRLDFMGFHSVYVSEYKDLKAEVGLGKQDSHNVTTTYGAKLHGTAVIGGSQILSLFVHVQR